LYATEGQNVLVLVSASLFRQLWSQKLRAGATCGSSVQVNSFLKAYSAQVDVVQEPDKVTGEHLQARP